jgi:hypothetical protein
MLDEDEDDNEPRPQRPKRESNAFTHTASQFQRIGKKWGVYKPVGAGRVSPCPHCGQPYTGKIKVFVNLLVAFGGGTGGFLLQPNGTPPPTLQKDFPEQSEFDEKEILPGSGDD